MEGETIEFTKANCLRTQETRSLHGLWGSYWSDSHGHYDPCWVFLRNPSYNFPRFAPPSHRIERARNYCYVQTISWWRRGGSGNRFRRINRNMFDKRYSFSLYWGSIAWAPHNSSRMFHRTHMAHNPLSACWHRNRTVVVSDKVSTRGARVVEHLFIAVLFHDIWDAGGLDPAIAAHFPYTLRSGVDSMLCE